MRPVLRWTARATLEGPARGCAAAGDGVPPISASGLYFETDVDLPFGSLLNLSVQFTQGGHKHWLACEGKVVRVSQADGRNGVAARLLTPFFSPAEEQLVSAVAKR